MRKKMILAAVLCLLTFVNSLTAVYAEENTESSTSGMENDFKTFHWGDSQEAIMDVEGEDPLLEDEVNGVDANYIAYSASVAGKDAVLAYYFCDQGFYSARYLLTEEHSNDDLYIDDYDDLRTALSKKYGEATYDYEDWSNDDKKSYYADRKGDALNYGYLSYITAWFTDRTLVYMEMSADNYTVTTRITFSSMEIEAGEADYSGDF